METLRPIDTNPFVSEYDNESSCDYCEFKEKCNFDIDKICKLDTDFIEKENNND